MARTGRTADRNAERKISDIVLLHHPIIKERERAEIGIIYSRQGDLVSSHEQTRRTHSVSPVRVNAQTNARASPVRRATWRHGAHDHCEASREGNARDILYYEQYGKRSSAFFADAGLGEGRAGRDDISTRRDSNPDVEAAPLLEPAEQRENQVSTGWNSPSAKHQSKRSCDVDEPKDIEACTRARRRSSLYLCYDS